MSYILDALKKADQEREQGHVPGLHAQQTLSADAPLAQGGLSPLVWAGIGVALTLAGVLTWLQWPASRSPAATAAPSLQATAPGTQPSPPATPTMPEPTLSTGSTGSMAPATPADRPSLALHVDTPPAVAERRTPPPAPSSQGPAPSARPPSVSTPKLAELPESVRKDLPALNVGGAMHSPTPSQRMLVLNGQVFHEGDSPHPGLVLEEIRLKSAVLNFQGQRFELNF